MIGAKEINPLLMKKQRRDIGSRSIHLPGNGICVRNITLITQFNGVHGAAAITAGHIHIAETLNRGRNGIHGLASALPEHPTSFDLVRPHSISATHNHLRNTIMHNDQWSSPGSDFVAVFFPESFSRALIQSDNERLRLMIPVND